MTSTLHTMETATGLPSHIELASARVIGCAIEVHKSLGPGLLEKIYGQALVYELGKAGLRVEHQVDVVIPYKETTLHGQRLDLLVERSIVIELKSIENLLSVHRAQLLSYLRAGQFPLGLLMNFNKQTLKEGLVRIVNGRANDGFCSSSRPSRSSR